jgi:hypothetical protein
MYRAADVVPVPKMIDACDPGCVSWTTWQSSPVAQWASSRHLSVLAGTLISTSVIVLVSYADSNKPPPR